MPDLRTSKLDNLFRLLDTDHDGQVCRADFEHAADRVARRCGAGDEAHARLRAHHAELAASLCPPGPVGRERFHPPRAPSSPGLTSLAGAIVAACDSDGDGELGSGEFRAFLQGWGLSEQDADMAFRHLDVDFSGAISAMELAEAFEEFLTSDDPHVPGNRLFGPVDDGPSARLPYPDPDDLPAETRQLLAALPPLNIFRMAAHAHTVFPAAMNMSRAILADMELPGDLRELAVLQVAADLGATYVWTQHVSAARAEHTPRAKVIAIRDGRLDAPCLTAPEQATLAFTAEVLHRGRPSDSTFARLRRHLSPRQIVELLIVTGVYTMIGRITTALALAPDTSQGDAVVGYATDTANPEPVQN
ncbi:EF-hand domain-containing protein [Actinomadura kijaniata]|uniref:EF-hand domain-containing protein n=1 Tax=Actinomadura kijaniata TaxID=46161 RepID=UPI0008310A6B|nr:EF-hand domain-containing protein [Actinomadura kijaniata]